MESIITSTPSKNEVRILKRVDTQMQGSIEKKMEVDDSAAIKLLLVHPPKQIDNSPVQLERTKLYIKNMVSIRCKMVVKAVLGNLGLNYSSVEFGEVEIIGNLSQAKREQLKFDLLKCGLELMEDKKAMLIEKIKKTIIEMIHYTDELPKVNFSDYLAKKLDHNYTYLAKLFSETEGTTIEHFILLHKIERVKELIIYDELNLTEIAWKLHYSNVGHLANQFKKITGLTTTHFKNMKQKRRSTLDNL